jgi:hypothetical protein
MMSEREEDDNDDEKKFAEYIIVIVNEKIIKILKSHYLCTFLLIFSKFILCLKKKTF